MDGIESSTQAPADGSLERMRIRVSDAAKCARYIKDIKDVFGDACAKHAEQKIAQLPADGSFDPGTLTEEVFNEIFNSPEMMEWRRRESERVIGEPGCCCDLRLRTSFDDVKDAIQEVWYAVARRVLRLFGRLQ